MVEEVEIFGKEKVGFVFVCGCCGSGCVCDGVVVRFRSCC